MNPSQNLPAADTSIVIRTAVLADAPALAELLDQLGYPTPAQEMAMRLERILARTDWRVAVAQNEGRVAGVIAASRQIFFEHSHTCGRVQALSVAEDLRGRGIGAALLAHVEHWLRCQADAACIVCSHTRRTDAHRFYQRQGYKVTGLRFVKDL
jgi:GNAT superfamily N-acetyltransferase